MREKGFILSRSVRSMGLPTKLAVPVVVGVLAASVARADVVAYWGLNEGSGQTTYDATGNGNTGTLQNGVSWTNDSRSGSALYFDGLDDRVSVIKTPSVDLTQQVTLDAWIKRDSPQNGTILSRNGPFFIAVRNDRFYGGIHTDGGPEGWTHVQGTSTLALHQWYHIALSYDGSMVRGYVNDVEEASAPQSGIMVVRSQQPWIGWGEPGHDFYFHGTLDDLAIHDVAIPSPSSLLLVGAGLGSRRRKKR